ncbi:MAG: hypothetical protein AAGD04_00770 [Pseudomonadota bacterium]
MAFPWECNGFSEIRGGSDEPARQVGSATRSIEYFSQEKDKGWDPEAGVAGEVVVGR